MFELFYSSGGHGGPYLTLAIAQRRAVALLRGIADRALTEADKVEIGFADYVDGLQIIFEAVRDRLNKARAERDKS